MRYFLDTEFAERQGSIELISLGIVAEDGREFYAENVDFDQRMGNDWVRANVVPQLWMEQKDRMLFSDWLRDGNHGGLHRLYMIGDVVRDFIGNDTPEFWGYYADYDWVVFCWLFGAMIDLPKGWPMYCRDLKQWCDQLGNPQLPQQGRGEHHALADARWNKVAWEFLQAENDRLSGNLRAMGGIDASSR